MLNIYKVMISCIVFLSLIGCTDQRILEKLGFIRIIGYDLVEQAKYEEQGKNLHVTFNVPKTDSISKGESETLSRIVLNSQEAWLHLNRETDLELVGGQLRTALFGIRLAKHGLRDVMDHLLRDPSFGKRIKVVVVNGVAYEALQIKYKEHPVTHQYIERMLEKEGNIKAIPETDLYTYTRDLYDSAIDPIAPVIKIGKNEFIVDGIALFHDDKYVSQIPPDEAMFFYIMKENMKKGSMSIEFKRDEAEKKDNFMIEAIKSERKIKVDHQPGHSIKVLIDITIDCQIMEYIGELNIESEDNIKKLERSTNIFLENATSELVKELQNWNTDSLGIGQYVRSSLTANEWKELDWKKAFPDVEITTRVNLKFRDTGIFKSSKWNL